MTAVNLLVADSAVAKTRRSQIMKRRWYNADESRCAGGLLRQVGMTLEADKPDIGPGQHLRISGAMRFVASLAALGPHGGVLISERSAQIRVAREATGFVCGERANLPRQEAAMRIVAVRARHGALRQPVRVGALERSPCALMAVSALLIDSSGLSGHQTPGFRLMHPMAAGTRYAASGMSALDATDMSRLIAMTGETGFVGSCRRKLGGVNDFLG